MSASRRNYKTNIDQKTGRLRAWHAKIFFKCKFIDSQAAEAESAGKTGNLKTLYTIAKQLSKEHKPQDIKYYKIQR